MKYAYRFLLLACAFVVPSACGAAPSVTGEAKQWHKVTLTFDGPDSSESATPNPFTDYRMDVTFTKGDETFVVPGYFAADGDAANTSAEAGNKWRVHFAPSSPGEWTWVASLKQGEGVAVADDTESAASGGFFDGERGSLVVMASDKQAPDTRALGLLKQVDSRYPVTLGNGEVFLKAGADAPENFLAYSDFDGEFKSDGQKDNLVKTWQPHQRDWQQGDPTWADGKGKGIVGAVNYLASEGMNAVSFLTLNIEGDDRNVFPYTNYDERERLDVSRLAQWEVVFEHATSKGLFLHFKTQESENEELLDGGDTGSQRRLYYRELIARFGHHPALNWNLGEENGVWGKHHKKRAQTTAQRLAMAEYFRANDPYGHPIVIHNGQWFDDLYGDDSPITGASLQTNKDDFSRVHAQTKRILRESAAKGKQWIVACDEPGDAQHSLLPDAEDPEHFNARTNALWGVLLAGGWGIEYYFGYAHAHSDLTCQDYRSRTTMWQQSRHALEFFRDNAIEVREMECRDELLQGADGFCLAKIGGQYVILVKNANEPAALDLGQVQGKLSVQWFNPRSGGQLSTGTVATIEGGGVRSLGKPPEDADADWVVLVNNSAAAAAAAGGKGDGSDIVVIEAEATSSDLGKWTPKSTVEGFRGDGYLEFMGNTPISGPADSPLEYPFAVQQDGLYYLHLHCAREKVGKRHDLANDAYVRVEGEFDCGPNPGNKHGDDAPLEMLARDTKFYGGGDRKFEWAGGNRLDPGGHNNKRVAVYRFKAGEEYTLVVSGRSKLFKLDRIAWRPKHVAVDQLD